MVVQYRYMLYVSTVYVSVQCMLVQCCLTHLPVMPDAALEFKNTDARGNTVEAIRIEGAMGSIERAYLFRCSTIHL
jgi:hypothetical protein